MTAPYLLNAYDAKDFPDVELALTEPDGLLALGGDLSVERLRVAYQKGIFPWYCNEQPILWWSPDPRMVLYPQDIKVSRSLAKKIRKQNYKITFDQSFKKVITACSQPRKIRGAQENETWILDEMIDAYVNLHAAGYAHSVEYWQDKELVGGLYGVAIGNVFFGESMFSHVSDASKVTYVYLVKQLEQWGFKLIDCQVYSAHLKSLGAVLIEREKFITLLQQHTIVSENQCGKWCADKNLVELVMKDTVIVK